MPTDYTTLSVSELKTMLTERKVRHTGTKTELVARLETLDTGGKEAERLQLDMMTLVDLKTKAKEGGHTVSGTKEELIARILGEPAPGTCVSMNCAALQAEKHR